METEQLVVQLEARLDKFEKSFERASQTADRRWREIENRGKASSLTIEAGFARTASAVTTAASAASAAMLRMGAVIGVALSIKEVIQAADSWTKFGSQLAAAGVPVDFRRDLTRDFR